MNHFQTTQIDVLIDSYTVVLFGLLIVMLIILLIRGIDRLLNRSFRWSPLEWLAEMFFRH